MTHTDIFEKDLGHTANEVVVLKSGFLLLFFDHLTSRSLRDGSSFRRRYT
jgi:hypothetical protein